MKSKKWMIVIIGLICVGITIIAISYWQTKTAKNTTSDTEIRSSSEKITASEKIEMLGKPESLMKYVLKENYETWEEVDEDIIKLGNIWKDLLAYQPQIDTSKEAEKVKADIDMLVEKQKHYQKSESTLIAESKMEIDEIIHYLKQACYDYNNDTELVLLREQGINIKKQYDNGEITLEQCLELLIPLDEKSSSRIRELNPPK